jgi:hypothetical protein
MPNLNGEIRKLKEEGLSLRAIAAALGVSHVAVLKRLKAIETGRQMVTNRGKTRLPPAAEENGNVLTGPNVHQLRESGELGGNVNQVVTRKTPSPGRGEGGNPSGNPLLTLSEGPERGVSECFDDLFGAIKEFLELNGVELYRMQVGQEAYQVKNNEQVIRIYVQRKKEEPKFLERVRGS